jgi:DNA-binding response OmpR family regulator
MNVNRPINKSTDNARKQILLIEDDQVSRDLLAEQLGLYGSYFTVQASSASEGLEKVKAAHYDAVLLDIGLPDMDGRELCKLMRRQGVRAPVIMLTAADSDAETILGLESGANDYVTKPFRINVLLARLRAHLGQHERSEDAVMSIGPYEFHPAARMLMAKGDKKKKKVRLTDKETSILKYLYRAGDRPVARDVLLDEVWGYNAGAITHTIETHIYRLRIKLEKDPSNPELLVTDQNCYWLRR